MAIRDGVPCFVAVKIREIKDTHGKEPNPRIHDRCRWTTKLWSSRFDDLPRSRGVWAKSQEYSRESNEPARTENQHEFEILMSHCLG